MKNIKNKLSALFVAMLALATACENEPITLPDSESIVGFQTASISVMENAQLPDVLYLGAPKGAANASVSYEVVTEGFQYPAIEGQDFTVNSTEASAEVGVNPISITINNDQKFENDKSFMLKITSVTGGYKVAAEDSIIITIVDDDHPLKNWIGSYVVEAVSYGKPGAWDERWGEVSTSAVVGDTTMLRIVGIAGSSTPIFATVDKDAGTITVEAGQNIGVPDSYGYEIEIYKGETDLSIPDPEAPLEGTASPDGSINVDFWGHVISAGDYSGYVWDVFNTSWTKQ